VHIKLGLRPNQRTGQPDSPTSFVVLDFFICSIGRLSGWGELATSPRPPAPAIFGPVGASSAAEFLFCHFLHKPVFRSENKHDYSKQHANNAQQDNVLMKKNV
jgi:hypothetical protein